ncbi:MAG: beta-Ala-His dipeptidase [Erysipelotrichaceae bacterium]|nr:beta-Ala-His dipeptidase [Erysipelotrichaceae bacterium]
MEFDLTKPHCFYFNEIAKIPHGSNNEKGLSDYLVTFAQTRGLAFKQDDMFNVIIYKPATEGYQQAKPLMIQAHMDMVCEKNKDSDHDFMKDPLKLKVEDGILRADKTTLGADDGTGVAYMLAILDDDNLPHPPLECVFTVQEETGLYGAMNLKAEDISAHRMISLDGGGETNTLLSSAGGCRDRVVKQLRFMANEDKTYQLSVLGLLGGHSGGEIHKEKGNANKLVMRIIKEALLKEADINLVSYNGGLKENAIPREADVVFTSVTPMSSLNKLFFESVTDIKTELEFSDPGFKIEFKEVAQASQKIERKISDELVNLVYLLPNGFKARSMAIENLTLTSLNLGVVTTSDDQIELAISIRSALKSGIENLIREIACLCETFKATYSIHAFYPGWNYSEVSPMREALTDVVKDIYDQDLELIAAHGGCECGVFKAMYDDMDIVSIGPKTRFIHTPDEELDLASFDRTYKLLTTFVSACK